MPEYIADLLDEEQEYLEHLAARLGYENNRELANNVLKDILSGRLKITTVASRGRVMTFYERGNLL